MLISWDNCWKVFIKRGELFEANFITWFNIVPTPNEFIERLFFWFPVCYDFWMASSIINFSQFFYSYFWPKKFSHSVIGILNSFDSVLIKFSFNVFQEVRVGNITAIRSKVITKIAGLLFSEMEFSTLQSPSKIIFIKWTCVLLIQTFKDFMQKSDTVNSSLS